MARLSTTHPMIRATNVREVGLYEVNMDGTQVPKDCFAKAAPTDQRSPRSHTRFQGDRTCSHCWTTYIAPKICLAHLCFHERSCVGEDVLANEFQTVMDGAAALDISGIETSPASPPLWTVSNVIISPYATSSRLQCGRREI